MDESLTDLCGGQFAVVPGHVIDDASISDGAFKLYALYCSRADTNGYGRLSNLRASNILGVSGKTISNRRRDLERVGLLEVTGLAKYRIIRLPEQRAPAIAKAAKRAVKNAPFAHYGKKGVDCKQAKDASPKEGKNLHPKTEEICVEEAKDSSPTHNQFKNPFSRVGTTAPLASPANGGSRGGMPQVHQRLANHLIELGMEKEQAWEMLLKMNDDTLKNLEQLETNRQLTNLHLRDALASLTRS